ncbi:MAG: UDP-N-acetylmuramoyl-tripeptide--D-alanyl-D-alanine ligase [Parcubacteria group bacterium LiPW_15]|nr:MAG: UDP-N-acetylmuramoyl-tripeptide--D-alanyl-D-alanine ligase [Parcubacteria group bacterium LiPW_15]
MKIQLKETLLKILRWKLKELSKLTIWRYRPGIIGITGSVGKTSAKLAIASVLEGERSVRYSRANFNNELGLPLTILGNYEKIEGMFFWPKVIFKAFWNVILKKDYPEILILEYGVDNLGDMKYLLSIAKPNVSVITTVGEIPAHVEHYSGPEEVAKEKAKLIESLPAAGFAVLNYDDETVMDVKERTRAHVVTFGFEKGAAVRVTGFEERHESERPIGVSFKIEYGGSFVPVRLDGAYGRTQGYASAAAAAVGLIFGLNLVKISAGLEKYAPAEHRMNIIPGVKYTYILDDCYNASPQSVYAALDVLREMPAKRRIAVLGDMLEIGKYTMQAHEKVGAIASKVTDILFAVGPRAKFIAEGARAAGMPKRNVYEFDTADEVGAAVQDIMKKGDIVLVKGSHAMQLDKVVEEIKSF